MDIFSNNLFRWILILIKRWFKLTLDINLNTKGTRSLMIHLVLFNILYLGKILFLFNTKKKWQIRRSQFQLKISWISRHYAFTDFISRLQSHWISAPNLIIRSFCVRVPLFYRGLEYLQFPQNTRNTYDSSMIIPLYVSTSSQDPLFWPSWNCESLEIFISTGRDSQLPYYQYLKLMPDATRVTIYVDGKNRR